MAENKSFNRGLLVGILAMLGAQAAHWFLTPMNHPDASALRTTGVGIQVVAGFGGAIWTAMQQRAASR